MAEGLSRGGILSELVGTMFVDFYPRYGFFFRTCAGRGPGGLTLCTVGRNSDRNCEVQDLPHS